MKWQPIDTAPKDGTRILLYVEGQGVIEGWWCFADWRDGGGYWEYLTLYTHGCGCCATDGDNPTFWIWVPNAPLT